MSNLYDRAEIYDLLEDDTRYSWNLRHWQKLFADKDIHTMLDVISLPLYWKRDAVERNGMVCCHGSEEKLIREMLTCKVHPQQNRWFCAYAAQKVQLDRR